MAVAVVPHVAPLWPCGGRRPDCPERSTRAHVAIEMAPSAPGQAEAEVPRILELAEGVPEPMPRPDEHLRFVEITEERHEDHLWGPASFAFAVRAAESFARFRWCVFIIGSRAGGMIDGLTHYDFPSMQGLQARCPLECVITSQLEHGLAEQGFISLIYDRASGQAMLHSAPSVQRPREFMDTPEGRDAEVGHRLGSQLPYVFLVSRLAHYLKRVQRERIGQWDNHVALQRELEQWLKKYVSDINEPHWETRARRPFRRASIQVEVVEGQTGWYRCHLQLQPHLTHNSAVFTLSLVGRLDRPDRR